MNNPVQLKNAALMFERSFSESVTPRQIMVVSRLLCPSVLDCADGYAGFMPARGARFAKAVEIEVFADWPVFAGDLNLFPFFVSTFSQDRSTLATVQAGALGDTFQLSKEVIVRAALFVDEKPAQDCVEMLKISCFLRV